MYFKKILQKKITKIIIIIFITLLIIFFSLNFICYLNTNKGNSLVKSCSHCKKNAPFFCSEYENKPNCDSCAYCLKIGCALKLKKLINLEY